MKQRICIVMILVISIMLQGCGRSSKHSGSQPWKELGVTKKQYEETYNRIKYGG